MKGLLETMKEITVVEPVVSIKSAVKEANLVQMQELVKALV